MKLLCGASLVLALAISVPAAADDFTYSPYYPMQAGATGATWTYKAGDSTFTLAVKDHRLAANVMCAHVETKQGDKVVGSEDVMVKDGWIVRVASDDKPIDPPVKILKLKNDGKNDTPDDGTWLVNSKVDPPGGGTPQTLSGTFSQVTQKLDEKTKIPGVDPNVPVVIVSCQDLDANGAKYSFKTYYVKDVGMVRQEITAGGLTVTLDKVDFKRGSE